MENESPSPYVHPWLVCFDGENHENQFCWDAFSNTPSRFSRSTPPGMIGSKIMMVTNHPNWFLLCRISKNSVSSPNFQFGQHFLHLWNPVTLQSYDLPPRLQRQNRVERINHALLTKSPDDPDCVLLLRFQSSWDEDSSSWWEPPSFVYCRVNGEDGGTWKDCTVSGPINSKWWDTEFCHLVAHGDDIWIMSTGESYTVMVKIDMTMPRISLEISRGSNMILCSPRINLEKKRWLLRNHLVTMKGEVFVISVRFDWRGQIISSIVVFRFDFSDRTWKIVDDCPNAAFFISPSCYGEENQAISCPVPPADSTRTGNRVYIARYLFHGENCKILLYTYHILLRTLSVTLLRAKSEPFSFCYWVLSHVKAQESVVEAVKKASTNRKAMLPNDGKRRKLLPNVVTSNSDDFPVDVLRIISSYLIRPIDYLCFRAVYPCIGSAKDWRIRSRDNEALSPHPWLIIPYALHRDHGYRIMDPATNTNYIVARPETLKDDSWIHASSNGWLLVSGKNRGTEKMRLHLYNPLTKATIKLPDSDNLDNFFFSSQGCQVFGLDIGKRYGDKPQPRISWYIELHHSGQMRWEDRRVVYGFDSLSRLEVQVKQSNVNAVHMNGQFYFLLECGRLGIVGVMGTNNDRMFRVSGVRYPCRSFERAFMVECDGDLLSIYVSNEWKRGLKVFKLNEPKMVWERVHHLNNNNLYLSNESSIATEAQSPQVGNRIYFPRFYRRSIVYFSMNTNKFHSGDGQVMNSWYESQELLSSCWFLPNWDNYHQFSAGA